jgi:hypothetical protein
MLAVGVVFLMLRIPLAQQYPGARDGSVLSALARVAQEGNHYSFWIGMLSAGAGGLLLYRVLLRKRLAPGFLAVYGLAGYVIFLIGAILEILGHNVGVALSIPGGLFEIAFGVLLIAKGFPVGQSQDRQGLPARRLLRLHPPERPAPDGVSVARLARGAAPPKERSS